LGREGFARLFLVPGADHGFRGAGASPSPAALLAAILAWVEEGRAPDCLLGEAKDKDGKVLRTKWHVSLPTVFWTT
jgi:hypothetical protein